MPCSTKIRQHEMTINGQVLDLKANNNGCSCDIHHVCSCNVVPGSIIRFQEVNIIDDLKDEEETVIAFNLLRDNGKGTSEDGKAFCQVGFIVRHLIANAKSYDGRYAEVHEKLENSLDVSVKEKKRKWILSCANLSSCRNIIVLR